MNLLLVGESLRRIRDQQLWRTGEYTSFTDYLARGARVRRAYAYDLMSIAQQFNEEIARRYGFGKLDAAVKYLRATARVEQPGDLLATPISVRAVGGQFESVPLHEATPTQIRAATGLLKKSRAGRKAPPPEVAAAAKRLGAALPPVPGRTASTRVRATRLSDGRAALSFLDIPVGSFDTFAELGRRELAPFQDRAPDGESD